MAYTFYINPGQSIQKVLDSANSGDTVIVNPGTYSENIVIKKTITLKSSGRGETIITAKDKDHSVISVESSGTDSEIYAFTISGSNKHGINIDGATNLIIAGHIIRDNKQNGIYNTDGDETSVNNNEICNNNSSGVYHKASACYFRYNSIHDNGGENIHVAEGESNLIDYNSLVASGADGIKLEDKNNTVASNTISNSKESGICCKASSCTISSNKVSNSGDHNIIADSSSNTIENNELDGCGENGIKIEGSKHTVTANTVNNSKASGICCKASDSTISSNNVSGSTDQNIYVNGTDNDIEKNT